MLNMGYFDINNDVPLDLTYNNFENRNKEILMCTNYINKHLDYFKNSNKILICDRAYYSYKFIKFLLDNNIKFIIRLKGNGEMITNNSINKHNKNYEIVQDIKNKIRLVKCKNVIKKTVCCFKLKRKVKEIDIEINNNCIIITNLTNIKKYNGNYIIDLYRKRWNIEVFFKLLKNNCKMQYLNELFSKEKTR